MNEGAEGEEVARLHPYRWGKPRPTVSMWLLQVDSAVARWEPRSPALMRCGPPDPGCQLPRTEGPHCHARGHVVCVFLRHRAEDQGWYHLRVHHPRSWCLEPFPAALSYYLSKIILMRHIILIVFMFYFSTWLFGEVCGLEYLWQRHDLTLHTTAL